MGPDHNLVLTGFMGTGKTAVGRELALKLGMEFVDTDEVIETRHGPIAHIFEKQGEAAFRDMERELAKELGERKGLVIATGGRMILDPANFRELSKNGRVFCLVATPEAIHHRVANDESRKERPLLQVDDPRQRIIELMAERAHDYDRFPQVITDYGGPSTVADEVASLWHGHDTYEVASPEGEYPYTVGAGILPFVRQLASIEGPVIVITDDAVRDLYSPSLGDVDLTVTLPSGRPQKPLESVQIIYQQLLEAGIDKSATAISLGGSVIGNIAGFVAATYLRGLDLVHCPTSLIAMVDTSVGGEVGLDVPEAPDLIGLHKQPRAVLADVGTLQTLPRRHLLSGLAEAVKHGLIASSPLLDRIETTQWTSSDTLVPGMLASLQSLVAQAIEVRIAIVQEDPYQESGHRTMLNLGHTFGYGIEYASKGAANHGEAVAMGLVAAARLSHLKGHASLDLVERIESIVQHIGLRHRLPEAVTPEAVLEGMNHHNKRQHARPRFVLLKKIGEPFLSDEASESDVLEVLTSMTGSASETSSVPTVPG
ncbi:MAG TPA: bifunctional shikimate kinase/3-dehydroquinate synthase [Acidimicrobiia bacterium]|nr:bifunctional shikimate kinase/3-dehydroquinate synthase [Acidimicrobiia bacterium]